MEKFQNYEVNVLYKGRPFLFYTVFATDQSMASSRIFLLTGY